MCSCCRGFKKHCHMCLVLFQRQWDSVGKGCRKENNTSLYGLVKCFLERENDSVLFISSRILRGDWQWGLYFSHSTKTSTGSTTTSWYFPWPWNTLCPILWHIADECSVQKWEERCSSMQTRQHKVRCCYFGENWPFDVVLKIDVWGRSLVSLDLRRAQAEGESDDRPTRVDMILQQLPTCVHWQMCLIGLTWMHCCWRMNPKCDTFSFTAAPKNQRTINASIDSHRMVHFCVWEHSMVQQCEFRLLLGFFTAPQVLSHFSAQLTLLSPNPNGLCSLSVWRKFTMMSAKKISHNFLEYIDISCIYWMKLFYFVHTDVLACLWQVIDIFLHFINLMKLIVSSYGYFSLFCRDIVILKIITLLSCDLKIDRG